MNPEFFFAYTQSSGFARWKDAAFIIATIQNIGANKYADLPVPVPPVSEQLAINAFLLDATDTLSAAIQRARQEIALLREYRTRLIADVVTGKLDVREAAASLPDEVDDVDAIEELDALADDDEMSDEDDA